MTRALCFLGLLVLAAGAVAPGCGGSEFTADGESNAGDTGDGGDAGESATGGNGGSRGGSGGSSSGDAGADAGGSDAGGNGNSGSGGRGGTSSGGASMGGDAGEGATGGSESGGTGGSSGASVGGAGSGSGGISGASGTGAGGLGGAGSGGTGGTGGAGSGGRGGTGGASSGGTGGGANTCPANAPSPSSACSFMGHCSYGTHPRAECRDVFACDGVRFQQTQDANCPTPPSCDDLPTPPVINAQCTPEGAECQGNLYCLCAADCSTLCTFPPIWHCFGAPGDCPDVLPNRGQPCNVNLSCVYGSCATQTGVQAICENGTWTWYGLICPQ